MTFLTVPNASKQDYINSHEQPMIVVIPLVILALMSIFFGYIAKDAFVGMGSDMLSSSLFVHPSHITLVEAEFSIPTFYKLLPAMGTLAGASLALLMYHRLADFTVQLSLTDMGKQLYAFLNGKWFFDVIVNHYVIYKSLSLGMITSKVLDRGAVELLGPFGLSSSLYGGGRRMSKLDTGTVTHYSLYIVIGLVLIALVLLLPVFFPTLRVERGTEGGVVETTDMRLAILYISAFFIPLAHSRLSPLATSPRVREPNRSTLF